MNTLAHAEIALIEDRGIRKMRVNLFKDGKITGFLKPVSFFFLGEGGRKPGGSNTI